MFVRSVEGSLIVALHHQHLRYGVHEQQHEAGYDAFLTARVFLALAAEMTGHGRDESADLNASCDNPRGSADV
jgi:DNA polymerase III epsilon subunit-like protein